MKRGLGDQAKETVGSLHGSQVQRSYPTSNLPYGKPFKPWAIVRSPEYTKVEWSGKTYEEAMAHFDMLRAMPTKNTCRRLYYLRFPDGHHVAVYVTRWKKKEPFT